MKVLEIIGRKVSCDVDALSKGLCELHTGDKAAVLAFGMLDAGLCELFEKKLTKSIKKEFGETICDIFPGRVEQFTKECISDIEKGVYRYAKMVV